MRKRGLKDEASARERVAARLSQARYPLMAAGCVALAALWGGASAFAVLAGFSLVVAAGAIGPRRTRAERLAARAAGARTRRDPPASPTQIIDALSDPAVLVGPNRQMLHQNGAALAMFGPMQEGADIRLRFRAPELLVSINAAFTERREAMLGEYRTGRDDRLFEVRATPVRARQATRGRRADARPGAGDKGARGGETGAAPYVLLVFREQTEARRLDRVRADFVANASHELRTPLTSIIGYIDTLRGPAREDAAARETFLGIMAEQAGRMSRLVEDLTQLSRAERRAGLPPRERIDLSAAADAAVDTARPLFEAQGVAIELDAPVTAWVRGDRDELIRAMVNLIENALRYGGSGGCVHVGVVEEPVAVDTRPTGRARTTGRAHMAALPGRFQVSVRDWGPGIERSHLPRLTERFYRVDADASRAHNGTGLGLAIVKHILMRHGTRLEIASTPGQGAAFSFSLRECSDDTKGRSDG